MVVHPSKQAARRWYTAELPRAPRGDQPTSFTIRFKVGTDNDWRWTKDETQIDDGLLLFLQPHKDLDFSQLFEHASHEQLSVRREQAEAPGASLFSVSAPVEPSRGQQSGFTTHDLGLPMATVRWFALVRLWSPWLAPRQGKVRLSLDKDAVLCSFLRNDGFNVVCLAISGIADTLTTFKNDNKGHLLIGSRNDRETEGTSRVLVAVAESFDVANAAVMYQARKIIAGGYASSQEVQAEERALMDKNVEAQWMEEWYDGLTYCTWNALGQNLTEEKIVDALDVLKKNNITISNLIIDDNWQSLSEGDNQFERKWQEFDANKKGFPRGMRETVKSIREAHPNIKHIAVWHAILGYWGGVDPKGKIAKDYKTVTVGRDLNIADVKEGTITVVAAEDAKRMYDDFYRFLSSCGIDSVKTDAQFFLDLISEAPARRDLMTTYQDAWSIAHLRHFSSRAISCMSQTPQIMFHSQMPQNKPTLLVRNSDDFFPEVPASHPWHIFCNAHNSLFTQHLNVLPDWDMFQTNHEWASFHGAARAVSGGPIYFTDYPGKHDIELINQMTGRTTRGRNVILRPHRVGKSMNCYAGYDEQALVKIGTYVGYARTGTGILGIFNCFSRPTAEFVALGDFPGVEDDIEYILRSFDGAVSPAMKKGDDKAMVRVELEVRGWSILSAHPLRTFKRGRGVNTAVAMLGMLGKLTGAAGVTGHEIHTEEPSGRLRIWSSMKVLGRLGIWISDLPQKSVDEDIMVLMFGQVVSRDAIEVDGCTLSVDVERAWNESGQDAGWSNEVTIEVFVL